MIRRIVSIGVVLLSAQTASTTGSELSAQLADAKVLTIEAAKTMADAAEAEAAANGWNVAIAIVDAAGDLVLLRRLDGVQVGSVDIAIAKARTAARFRRETKVLADAIESGATALLSVEGIISLEGGIPVSYEGDVIGGIGASGVQAFQDAQVSAAGAAALRP